ncbi:FGFR1 oncogene partner [Oryzias melastigma]|uniref:FGFR1 oncogene partner n=1 Tax=Oryzias melastigma TaxID=30732 RepID=UPI000CF7B5F0|nr:FGFR1 oncogene partner [Oryzias melastigma]
MSAADDDTELRDLVVQNLESNGALNKMKAEMRAAVFLAMEDQDRLENKVPLVNESLKKCLNSRDGRLAVAFIVDFLQVFSLDFSLSVFLPEINFPNGVDSREVVCRELGLQDPELDKNSPLLLELLRTAPCPPQQELSQNQIQNVQKTFDLYKNQGGLLQRRDLKSVFTDLFPNLNKHDLEKFFADELQAADQEIDFQFFLLLFKRLLHRCSHADSEPMFPADKYLQQLTTSSAPRQEHLDLDLNAVVNLEEGDSFFDDPLPKPHNKTYGCSTSSAGDQDFSEGSKSQHRWRDPAGTRGGHAETLSAALRPGGRGGGSSRKGASDSKDRSFKAPSDRTSSLHLDEDFEYDDDFHSHRSELTKSEQSIDDEIQEVSIEGPDSSDKLEETTLDVSVSQLSQAHAADFMEDVS